MEVESESEVSAWSLGFNIGVTCLLCGTCVPNNFLKEFLCSVHFTVYCSLDRTSTAIFLDGSLLDSEVLPLLVTISSATC